MHLTHHLMAVITEAALLAWVATHEIALLWLGAVLIERLPPPDGTSGKFYAYVYSVLQVIAANTKRSQDAVVVVNGPKDTPK